MSRELAWTTWALGVIAIWSLLRWPLVDLEAVCPQGMAQLLGHPAVVRSPIWGAGAALALAWLWVRAGQRVLREMGPAMDAAEDAVLGAGLGLGIGGTLIAWLGVALLLKPPAIAAVCAGWAAVGLLPVARRCGNGVEWPVRDGVDAATGAALAIGALGLGIALLHAVAPPWQPDALYYQLTLPRLYLEAGGFVKLAQEPVVSGYPGLGQMFFAIALAAGRDDLAALASWVFAALFVLATYVLVRGAATGPEQGAATGPEQGATEGGANRAPESTAHGALLAAATVASMPQLAFAASAPLVDTITAAYIALATHATVRAWHGHERTRWTGLASALIGFAVANKYLALPAAGLLALALVASAARSAARGGIAASARAAALVTLMALVPCAPWMIKNARDWGTPLFPLHCPQSLGATLVRVVREHQESFASNGLTTAFPWLPFDITFLSNRDDIGRYQGELGPLVLALLPLPLATGARGGRGLGLLGLALFAVWSLATRQLRFLLPALPPLLAWALASGRRPEALGAAVVAGAAVGLLATLGWLRPGNDLGYLSGRESRAAYYRSMSATEGLTNAYAALEREPPGKVIFFWEYRGYLCPRAFLPEHTFRLLDFPREPRAVLTRLRELGASHILINRSIWDEEPDHGAGWPFAPTLLGLLALDGVERVPLPESHAPLIELYRLPR